MIVLKALVLGIYKLASYEFFGENRLPWRRQFFVFIICISHLVFTFRGDERRCGSESFIVTVFRISLLIMYLGEKRSFDSKSFFRILRAYQF